MFKSEYQGGSHVEVFSAQGRDPAGRWRLQGAIRKEYSKEVKGYVYVMEGGTSTTTTKMQLPKNDRTALGLLQRYCVLQLMVPEGARFAVEMSILDGGGSRRRIQFSTSLREVSATPLNARVPLTRLVTGQWLNLCLDLRSWVSGLFRGQTYKSLEGLTIGGTCLLRRVFTLRSPPPDTVSEAGGNEGVESIPRACQMLSGSAVVQTQVFSFSSSPGKEAGKTFPSSSQADSRPTHVAFGTKITVPDHILSSRQTSRASSTEHRVRTGGSSRESSSSTSATIVDGRGLVPRPPTRPANHATLRIQKNRVRILSGRRRGRGGSDRKEREEEESSAADSGYKTVSSEDKVLLGEEEEEENDEDLVIAALQRLEMASPHPPNGTVQSLEGEVMDDSIEQVDESSLQSQNDTSVEEEEDVLYSYRSPPRSAAQREPNLASQLDASVTDRGAHLHEDFVVGGGGEEEAMGQDTRLSDDYDWRRYTTTDGGEDLMRSDESLRTRLARAAETEQMLLAVPLVDRPHSNSSEMGSTLSGSMTLSGWTERMKEGSKNPMLDSLEVGGMGGALSPTVGTLSGSFELQQGWKEGEDELELVYDPHLNCYYDPHTHKYYELVQ